MSKTIAHYRKNALAQGSPSLLTVLDHMARHGIEPMDLVNKLGVSVGIYQNLAGKRPFSGPLLDKILKYVPRKRGVKA